MRRQVGIMSLCLVGMILLSACGSKPLSTGALQKVTLAVATKDLNIGYPFATLPLAMGWFKEEGLDVQVVPGDSSQGTIQLLVSGKADLGVLVPDSAIIGTITNNVPVKSVYAISRKNSYAFAVMPDSPIKSVADLKGKKVGHADLGAGTVPYAHARYKESGFTEKDVQEINVGYGAPTMEALKNGTIDAYVSFTGGWARLKSSGYDFRLLPDAPWQNKMYGYNAYASGDYISKNGDVIAKVGRAMAKATVFLKSNPEAGVKIFWDQYPDRAPKDRNDTKAFAADLAILQGQLSDMRVTELPADFQWGSQDLDTWTFQQDYLLTAGLVNQKIDPQRFFDNSQQVQFMKFDVNAIVKQAKDWKPK